MIGLWGVMDDSERDLIYTYEAEDAEEAAALYLDDPDSSGVLVRVWMLGKHPEAFVKAKGGAVLKIANPEAVSK